MKRDERKFLVISGHDYRSKRKANLHFIGQELAKEGEVCFFSLGFSFLSDLRGRDPRSRQNLKVNEVETVESVKCYLWRTSFHPFNLKIHFFPWLAAAPFRLYKKMLPEKFFDWVIDSDVILVESGIAVVVLDIIKRIHPCSTVIYVASDDLTTVEASPFLVKLLNQNASQIDLIIVPSKCLVEMMPAGPRCLVIEHGIDPGIIRYTEPSPYKDGINAVSVGTMLFDPLFFEIACQEFPEVKFHVIGSGCRRSKLPSTVFYYEEMRFEDTIRYIKHADFGVAPYKKAGAPSYLADTSMKLIQFNFLGINSVCPYFAVGDHIDSRAGYEPGDRESIRSAIERVMRAGKPTFYRRKNWNEITLEILRGLKGESNGI